MSNFWGTCLLLASDFEFVNLVNDTRYDQHYLQVGFLAKDVDGNELELKEPEKCEEWRWFDLNDLPEPIFVGHKEQIECFKNKKYFSD